MLGSWCLVAIYRLSPLDHRCKSQHLAFSKNTYQKGSHFTDVYFYAGDPSIDAKDAEWTKDSQLEPVDLNKVNARTFVVYKFGVFVSDLVASHCHHHPITILLADKIPPNNHLSHNLYRNSFHFDANNRILYVRTSRLDSVGEFALVLVHCMAHIKSGKIFYWEVLIVFKLNLIDFELKDKMF